MIDAGGYPMRDVLDSVFPHASARQFLQQVNFDSSRSVPVSALQVVISSTIGWSYSWERFYLLRDSAERGG